MTGCTMFPSPQEMWPETMESPTEPEPTQKSTESSQFPYLVYINNPDTPIYAGPGYEYACVGAVQIATQYTIMEHRRDESGNIWGRLKSGVGWVNLTRIRYR